MSASGKLEKALLAQPNVAACIVLGKHGPDGERRIAYVVPIGAFSRKAVENRILESFPGVEPADGYVLVSTLPLTERGAVDEASLLDLPVPDEDVARAIEAELLADPRIEQAAVFVDELPRRPSALHLSDLVSPDALGGVKAAAASSETRISAPEPSAEVAPDPSAAQPAALPPAFAQGAALTRPPGGPETLPDALRIAAERAGAPGITYLSNDGTTREQSLPELWAEARRICKGLQKRGLSPGQYLLLQLADAEDVLPAFWGCLLGGFIPAITPIPPSYEAGTNELERLCQVWQLLDGPPLLMRERLKPAAAPLQARLSIAHESLIGLDELRQAPDSYDPPAQTGEDVAFLVFTSGSTGAPKIIQLSHKNILTRSQGTNQLCQHEPSDRILNWLPFDHIGSISDWHLRCIDLGCHMVYSSKEYVLGDPLNWLRLIDRFRITHSWAPNFAYALVNEALNRNNERYDLRSMKALLTAGEAVSSNTVHDFLRRLADHGLSPTALRPAFGMAELGSGVTYYLPTRENPVRVKYVDRTRLEGALRSVERDDPLAIGFTSLGPVIPGAGMRIVDESNVTQPELTIGRLQISGGPVCRGYFRNPEANREVFVGEGWFNTGDRGFIADGELYLTGRDKESLIVNGANYSNSEIEAVVEEVPGVQVSFAAACAVRPAGDPEERLAIFFSPAGATGIELSELLRKVQNSVTRKTGVKPDYLLPVAREQIPKTAIGKIQRKQLVKRFEAGEFAALLTQVDVLLENEKTVPDWFLAPGWRPQLIRKTARQRPRSALLLSDRHGFAREIAQRLERAGFRTATAAPEERASIAACGADLTDVVHVAGYGPRAESTTPRNGGSARSASAAAAQSVTDLFGILAQKPGHGAAAARTLRHWVVSSHSQTISETDTIDAAQAIIPAAIKAFEQDVPAVECRHLDLAFTTDSAELSRRANLVADEIEAITPEREVAFRDGIRLVPGFERVGFPPLAKRSQPLTRGGYYLLTGGLGGVGAELARYLLTVWGASLLLIGRTPIEAASSDSPKAALLAELTALGPVRYRALNIADAAQIESAVVEQERVLGKPLAGVFHLASVYHERPATEESTATFAAVLEPKIDGAIALHELLVHRPEAFVVCFSSVVSVFGVAGFAAYAAANRFLDRYCDEQRSRLKRKSYSIDWSVWDGLGIAAESASQEILARLGQDGEQGNISSADINARLVEAERSRGYLRMPAAQGMRSLTAVLSLPPDQLMVGVDVTHPNMASLTIGRAEPLLGIRGAFALKSGADDCDPSSLALASARDRFDRTVPCALRRLPALPLTAEGQLDREAVLAELRGGSRTIVPPQTPLEQQLAEIWKDVLGLESLGITESFFDLGGTSLLSVRLFAEIERRIGVSLQLATLFQAATIQALADLIEARSSSRAAGSLAPLAAASGEAALFLIHDVNGEVGIYQTLAERLAPEVRVYGLPPRAKDRFLSLNTRIEDMVSHHVEQIRGAQPNGPYLVGGADAGGVLAFEVACRLQDLGERVLLLALFDATDSALRMSLARTVREGLAKLQAKTVRGKLQRLAKVGFDHARVRLLDRYVSRGADLPWFLELIPPRVVYSYAISRHRPARFSGRITLYQASRATANPDLDTPARDHCEDRQLGWSARATEGVDVVEVAGGHVTMLGDPHVAELAAKLGSLIRTALRDQPGADRPGAAVTSRQQPFSA